MSAPFEQLERDLLAAAARLATGEAAAPFPPASRDRGDADPLRRRLRIPAAALAVVLLALAAAGAWVAADREASSPGTRVAPAWRLDVGESRIASVRAPAAGAQPDWTVRVSRPTPAVVCVTVGQVSARKLGLAGSDGRFRELPTGRADACGAGSALAARLVESGETVVGGFAGDGLRSVRIEQGGAPVTVPHGPEGAFVHVTHSTRATPVVWLRWKDGRAERFKVPSAKPAVPPRAPSGKLPAMRDPSASTPLSPALPLPALRRVEPSPSPAPVEPAPSERRGGSM